MHNASFRSLGLDAVYLAFDVVPERLMEVLGGMAAMGFRGVNLTIPHKQVAFAGIGGSESGRLAESAQLVGGVNTVAFTENGLEGHSTDGFGFLTDLKEQFDFDVSGKRVFVIGVGGAGRAVALTAARAGADTVILNSRNAERRQQVADEIAALGQGTTVIQQGDAREADLVVNGTPVGMRDGDPPLLDAKHFHDGQVVYDMIYVRPVTPFLEPARAAGAQIANGLGMLLHQGAESFRIWTGTEPDTDAMGAALQSRVYGSEPVINVAKEVV